MCLNSTWSAFLAYSHVVSVAVMLVYTIKWIISLMQHNKHVYYIPADKMYIFICNIHRKNLLFTAVKYILHIFNSCFAVLFSSANTHNLGKVIQIVISKRRKMYIVNRIFKVFSINTGFIFILWYENYISLLATATHEIFNFHTT
jgi:hypothetical protein